MILFALFFLSCRVRRLSMTQSFSCLLLSAESANNRLSSVQFGEKEEHYLSKIKKISWTKKKKKFFLWLWRSAPLHLLLPLLPNTNLSTSDDRCLSAVQLGEKDERIFKKKKIIAKKKFFLWLRRSAPLHHLLPLFTNTNLSTSADRRLSAVQLGEKEELNLEKINIIAKEK